MYLVGVGKQLQTFPVGDFEVEKQMKDKTQFEVLVQGGKMKKVVDLLELHHETLKEKGTPCFWTILLRDPFFFFLPVRPFEASPSFSDSKCSCRFPNRNNFSVCKLKKRNMGNLNTYF
jgi:hypothetical protein